MTWQLAQNDGLRRLALLGLPAPPARLDGLTITLIDFDTRELCGFLIGGNSHEYQRNVNRAVKRALERRGATVKLRHIKLAEAVRWGR